MRLINDRAEFRAFAREVGVRPDWHEPDEQDLFVEVRGSGFDNAGFWGRADVPREIEELHVVFKRHEPTDENLNNVVELAAVNLATLCAWASEKPAPQGKALELSGPEVEATRSAIADFLEKGDDIDAESVERKLEAL